MIGRAEDFYLNGSLDGVGIYNRALTPAELAGHYQDGLASLNVNDAPVANPITLAPIAEDSGAHIITASDLLAGVTDVDGQTLSITSLSIQSGNGALVDNGNQTWTYTPALNDDTSVTFAYTVSDGMLSASSTASLDVIPVNDAPVAGIASLGAIDEDSPGIFVTASALLQNVIDADGPQLTVTSVTIATGGGTLVDTGFQMWDYRPAPDDDGDVTFNFTASDGEFTASSTALLVIRDINDAPVATPVTLTAIPEDSGAHIIIAASLLAGVTDVDSPTLTITSLGLQTGNGTLVDNGNQAWTYTPATNDDTSVTFAYTVSDGMLSAGSTAVLDITPVNNAPTVSVTSAPANLVEAGGSTPGLSSATATLVKSDIDGGVILHYDITLMLSQGWVQTSPTTIARAGAYGTATLTFDNFGSDSATLSYALDNSSVNGLAAGQQVFDTFTVSSSDGALVGSTPVTFTIEGADDTPLASPVVLTAVAEGSSARIITAAELLAGVTDVDSPTLTITSLGVQSGNGTLVDNGNQTWTYTPAANDDTSVTFAYTASDGSLAASSTASLDLTPVNDAPTALPVNLGTIAEDSGLRIISNSELLAGASDVDGPILEIMSFFIVTGEGRLEDAGAGNWRYIPAENESGTVTLSYTVTDGNLAATSTASLDITPVNDAPVVSGPVTAPATEDGPRVSLDALANASDPDSGATLSITDLPTALPAGVTLSASPILLDQFASISVPPNSTDGSQASADGVWSVSAPVDDTIGIGYIINPIEGNSQFTLHDHHYIAPNVPNPSHAVVTFEFTDPKIINTIDVVEHSNGVTRLHAYVGDSLSDMTDIGAVFGSLGDITGAWLMNEGQHNIFHFDNTLAGTFLQVVIEKTSLVDGYALYRMYPAEAGSLFTLDPSDPAYQYLGEGETTTVTVNYSVSDGIQETPGSVSWIITGVNDAPTCASATVTTAEDTAYAFSAADFGFADVDASGTLAAVRIDTLPLNGTLALAGGAVTAGQVIDAVDIGSLTFTPALDAYDTGYASFTFSVSDGAAFSVTPSTLNIDVTPVNDSPSALPVTLTAIAEDSGTRIITAAELLTGVSDPDDPSLSITELTIQSGNGLLVDNGDQTWTYTPAANGDTSVTFAYTAGDGSLFASSTASLDITPVNDAPTGAPTALLAAGTEDLEYVVAAADLLQGFSDVDGDTLTVASLTSSSGSITDNHNGSYTISAPLNASGPVTLTYDVTDGHDTITSQTRTFTRAAFNDAPTAIALSAVTIGENNAAGALVGRLSATDPDNASGFTYALVTWRRRDRQCRLHDHERQRVASDRLCRLRDKGELLDPYQRHGRWWRVARGGEDHLHYQPISGGRKRNLRSRDSQGRQRPGSDLRFRGQRPALGHERQRYADRWSRPGYTERRQRYRRARRVRFQPRERDGQDGCDARRDHRIPARHR